MRRDSAWNSRHCVRAAFRPDNPCRRWRPVRFAADRNVLVLLREAPDADRFHLSSLAEDPNLCDGDLNQLRQGAGAAPPDPFGLWRVAVPPADRAARAIS